MKILFPAIVLAALQVSLAQSPVGLDVEAAPAAAQQKSDLRVLLVGHDPDHPKVAVPSMADERTLELYSERTEAFRSLLTAHFQHVTVVYGDAYEIAMSDEVDVTLFDCRPKHLPPTKQEESSDAYVARRCLPMEFSRPALMIADNSSRIGESIGLKLDWL